MRIETASFHTIIGNESLIPQSHQEAEKKQKKFKKSTFLLLILLAAFMLRLIYLWGQYQHNPIFNTPIMDSLVHHQWALKIASGEGMDHQPYFRAPLYYYSLALIYKLFGPSIGLARLLQCLMGSISCYLIGLIAYRLKGFWTGMLAGIIAVFYWPLIYFDAELLSVGLEVFLNLLLLWTLFQAESKHSQILFTVSGFLLGLSAITRPSILVFIPGILAWLILSSNKSQKRGWAFLMTLLVMMGASLPILSVTLRNYFIGGEPIIISSQSGVNFYIGNNPLSDGVTAIVPGTRGDWWGGYEDTHHLPEMELGRKLKESEISDYWYKKSFQWIRSEPVAWACLMLRKFPLFWIITELPNNKPIHFFARFAPISAIFWIGFPFVATLGLAALIFIRKKWHPWFLLLSFMILHICGVVIFFCPARYRLPVVPVLILLTSIGISCTIEEIKLKCYKRPLIFCILCTIIATALYLNPLKDSYNLSHQEAQGYCILGLMLAQQGKFDEAIEQCNQSLQIVPYNAHAHYISGKSLSKLGKTSEAIEKFQEALRIDPANSKAHFNLAGVLFQEDKLDEAIEHYEKALQINPVYMEVYNNLGIALVKKGRFEEAIDKFRQAIRMNPDDATAYNNLAWFLATCPQEKYRNGNEATKLATEACELTGFKMTNMLDTLAATYAEQGDFKRAVDTQKKAMDFSQKVTQMQRNRLKLYQSGLAYREK